MRIEIWSDVMCPFCYIGKRRFEKALAQVPFRDELEIEWKSFQLSPHVQTDPDKNVHQYLAEHKGISLEEARSMNNRVSAMAAEEGLEYNFDESVVANSFKAHRFAHFAKEQGKQDQAEERLFSAYFTEGKNIDDFETLLDIGRDLGLNMEKLQLLNESNLYEDDVRQDLYEAQQVGVSGVPFFLFNSKYAVTGAQSENVFKQALETAFSEWKEESKL